MTKTICDICGKEMPTQKYADRIDNYNFCISSYGKILDVCTECRDSLEKWMTIRKAGSEGGIILQTESEDKKWQDRRK